MAELYADNMCFRIFLNPYKNRSEVRLHKYLGNDTIVKIPEFVETYQVTEIGQWAFEKSSVEKVYYPNSINCIENGAFMNCHKLRTIENYQAHEPSEILDIMQFAFNRCENLEIFQSDAPLNIWYQAFQGCTSLKNVEAKILCFSNKSFLGAILTELHLADNVLWAKGSFEGMSCLTDLHFDGKVSDGTCKSYIKYIRRKRLHVNVHKFNYMELAYEGTEILSQ